jgi:hypothetical protein
MRQLHRPADEWIAGHDAAQRLPRTRTGVRRFPFAIGFKSYSLGGLLVGGDCCSGGSRSVYLDVRPRHDTLLDPRQWFNVEVGDQGHNEPPMYCWRRTNRWWCDL